MTRKKDWESTTDGGDPGLRMVAAAKVNWTLEVLRKREDGFHEIRSILQTISLEDELSIERAPSYSLTIAGRHGEGLSAEDNLVTRAAQSFPEYLAKKPVQITLVKAIPAAAGLGGGSSDAATALRLLRHIWGIQEPSLIRRAAESLGSDVPFFLRGGAQLAAGRGEDLSPLTSGSGQHLILVTPPIHVEHKTARMYGELTPADFTDGSATERAAAKLRADAPLHVDDYFNVFDAVADRVFPSLPEYRRLLEEVAGSRALLAGAGPSLFALCEARDCRRLGTRHRQRLERAGVDAWGVHTTGTHEALRWGTHGRGFRRLV